MTALRELINASNQAECAQPLVSSCPHLVARAHQSYAIAAFLLRLMRVFGAADATSVSDAWKINHSAKKPSPLPITKEAVVKAAAARPLWVSMDAPKVETLATAFHGAAEACQLFVKDVEAAVSGKCKFLFL